MVNLNQDDTDSVNKVLGKLVPEIINSTVESNQLYAMDYTAPIIVNHQVIFPVKVSEMEY